MKRDVSGRALEPRPVDWARLFAPRRVVVIGATDTEGTQQRAQFVQTRERLGARGADVVPVHPTKPDILGTKAYRSIADVPGDVDVAVVLVRDALLAVEECLRKGVAFTIVFSAGFGEVGTAEGDAAEARLAELASGPMRVIGPNTNLNIFEPWPGGFPGRKLVIVTQSGYQGRPITQGQVLGIGIESWATIGNEADLEWADFVSHYVDVENVGAIATYVEGFRDGRAFMLAVDKAARRRVPIVAIKVGRTEAGREMARAHTGHLTGSDAVHQAVFDQFGVIRVDDLDEVIEMSGMFCHTVLVDGRGGVGVYAMSGGTASHVADLCGAEGVLVPRFAQETIDALAEYVPWFLRRDNPLDSGGVITALPENRRVLELVLADPNVDILFAPITGVFPGMSDALAEDLVELHREGGKPVVAAWTSPIRDDPAYRALCEAGVPLFHSFGGAIRGIKALVTYSHFTRNYRSPFASVPRRASPARAAARAMLAPGEPLDEVAAKELLAAYGIARVAERVTTSAADAVRAARAVGLPVVMKILSRDIAHKSDLGLVEVGVETEARVRTTYRRLCERAREAAPGAAVDGVVVQAMVHDAVAESILGLSQQPPFGPTILYGLGGIFAEVFEDVSFRVPPFTRAQARAMVEETRGARLLHGARGRPPGDLDALVDSIMKLQRLALELGDDIAELDVNPLMIRPKGEGVVAVDALVLPSVLAS
ncbi:MAG TPA: acetate--CoA ligase family protein [Acidimicrobiia bacterium]|nr:acetate--CoA ligase family protein [Acidimicrobiia bacterium]